MNTAATALALALLGAPAPEEGAAVRTGLQWLVEHQNSDGSWNGQNGLIPTTITATAGLALLMEGSTPKEGAFAPQIRKTIAWFERHTNERGQLGGTSPNEKGQYVLVHAHGLLFLACAYDADDDAERRARLAKLIARATAVLVEQQTERGGWGFTNPRDSSGYDDSACTAAAMQALFAVRKAGIEVPKTATDRGLQYFVRSTNEGGGVRYMQHSGLVGGSVEQPFYSALVAACTDMQNDRRPDTFAKWVRKAQATSAAQQTQFLSQGYAASGLIALGPYTRLAYLLGENGHRKLDPEVPEERLLRWSAHRAQMYKSLREAQKKNGSWTDRAYGPAYATALALIVLQLDNGYLPAFAR